MTEDTSKGFGAVFALTVGVAFALALMAGAPKARPEAAQPQVAAVFAPWLSNEDVLARVIAAGARPVRFGKVGTIAVVTLEDKDTSAALRRRGAWLLLDPIAAGGCGTGRDNA
ncbi:MAG: hypothetical protein LCH56_12600 [Proteobacteria bacterium]|nr:hypothetical protein [Pseudomonadota bacterium]